MPDPAAPSSVDALRILINPYDDVWHARAIFDLLNSYAQDPMGGGDPLPESTRRDLVPELRRRPWVVTLLALSGDQPVGLMIAMEGFSTFAAKPLMNIHDVAVHPDYRGKGIGTALFREIEAMATKRGCCKLTLEVLEHNDRAKGLYGRLGFHPYILDPEHGAAQFWEKPILR